MRTLLTALRNAPKRASALIAMIAAVLIVPAILLAWGPDRPTYTIAHPADHITFNSITDNPDYGDERNFVRIKDASDTSAGNWKDQIAVQPGKEYLVQMYVHNNAASNLNLVAQNTRVMANVPNTTGKSVQIDGFITADNASPTRIWDQAVFTGDNNFNLTYVNGSTKMYNNVFGQTGTTLSDSIVTSQGALVGYDKLDGKIPGCFQYSAYVSFKVKAQAAATPSYTITKDVRKSGDKTFVKSVTANSGDKLNYRLTFANTGNTQLNNVNLQDILPKGVTNVPGTVRIMNANNPAGAYIQNGDNLFKSGVNIGAYTAGSNALVIFDATVDANDSLPACGANTLHNIGKVQPEGQTVKEDSADVMTNKTCVQPKQIQVCELATGKIVTINESDFNSSKQSKNLNDCAPKPGMINVCDLTTKQVISIKTTDFDSKKHSKNLADCVTAPVAPTTPTELPHTGPAETVISIVGLGSLIAASAYYVASRRALN